METSWSTVLWRQFGAAIDMLDNALAACPDSCWTERLSSNPPPSLTEFWWVAFHAIVWTDRYLSGVPGKDFAPPAPFAQGKPPEPYTKEELRAYLASTRRKCQTTLVSQTDEQARRLVYPWSAERPISYLELQLYNLRHVQEHAAQLSLFLGQHGVPDADLDWVAQAKGESDR